MSDSRQSQPQPELWDFWEDRLHAPAMNMALDEVLLLTAAERGRPLVRFYGWDRCAVSIGYVQKFAAAPQTGYVVVRRPTGGGVVYHDHDFTYSVVIPPGHWLTGLNRTRSYDWINRSVLAGLEQCRMDASLADGEIARSVDRASMVCFSNPTRYDILVGDRKVAGSAQRRTRSGLLHQGSIHFGGPLPLPREQLSRALQNGFNTVLNVSLEPYQPDAELLTRAETLAAERYATPEWNRRR